MKIFAAVMLLLSCELSLASDLGACQKYKTPISYDIDSGYVYDQTETNGYYHFLIDVGHVPYHGLDIDGGIRIILEADHTATVHYLEQHYRIYTNEFGYEQKEILRTDRKETLKTTWWVGGGEGAKELYVDGVGYGVPAYCSSSNPGLHFTYTRGFQPLNLKDKERYMYLGGANYDVLNPLRGDGSL